MKSEAGMSTRDADTPDQLPCTQTRQSLHHGGTHEQTGSAVVINVRLPVFLMGAPH